MLPEDTFLVVEDMQSSFLRGTTQTYTASMCGLDEGVSDETPLLNRSVNRGCLDAVNCIIIDSYKAGKGVLFLKYDGAGPISDRVLYSKEDETLEKRYDYGFEGTDLEKRILNYGAKRVLFIWSTANGCIRKTVLPALEKLKPKGIDIYVAQNAVFSSDEDQKRRGIHEMKSEGAKIIDYVPYAEKGQQLEFLF